MIDNLFNLKQDLPQKSIPKYIDLVCPSLVPIDNKKNLLNIIPTPISINNSDSLGKFINSEFNHDGESYRSPWSNQYFPINESKKRLVNELRELEIKLNKIIKMYAKLYYGEDSVSSVYIWEQGELISSGFNVAILITNKITDEKKNIKNSFMDSINVINIKFTKEREERKSIRDNLNVPKSKDLIKVTYKITSTVLFEMNFKNLNGGFNGNITKIEEDYGYLTNYLDYEVHCNKIGKLLEKSENNIRVQLGEISFNKTEGIITSMRNTFIKGKQNIQQSKIVKELFEEKIENDNKQTTIIIDAE